MKSQHSYTDLLYRHRSLVWTLCWARAHGDYEYCRDLVQEVSLSLWEHYGSLRPKANVLQERSWVFWHTRTVLNHLHRRPSPTLVPLMVDVVDESDDSKEQLEDLIACLGDNDRALVRLRLEGYDATEIAQQLHISRDAVYQRLHRIIDGLKKGQK